MDNIELEAILKHYRNRNKDDWELTRFLAFITAQTQSTKKLKLTDILKFDWDAEDKEEEVNWLEIKSMREILKRKNNGEQ